MFVEGLELSMLEKGNGQIFPVLSGLFSKTLCLWRFDSSSCCIKFVVFARWQRQHSRRKFQFSDRCY